MAFKYETQYNSPNYTPKNRVQATWGRPRTIEAIAIHWWGDPNTGPTYEGVISVLCNPNRRASAHFVATGTGRRVACLVDLNNASWATNSANPYTISIECDPRARDEDYDVVAELIAKIRSVYGNIPLVPHRQFIATACPGNYDLNRLNAIAATKIARPEDDWGVVSTRNATPPAPAVKESSRETFNPTRKYKFNKDSRLYDILTYTKASDKVYKNGEEIEIKQSLTLTNGNHWYRTVYSSDNEIGKGFRAEDLTEITPPSPGNQLPATPTQPPAGNTGTNPTPTPKPEVPKQETVKLDAESTTLMQDLNKLLKELIALLNNIFNRG